MAINIGKYLDGESAKNEYEDMMAQKKMKVEVEKGNIILTGEERIERSKQGESVPVPKPISLNRKRGDHRTQFEKDNDLPKKDGPEPIGDIID